MFGVKKKRVTSKIYVKQEEEENKKYYHKSCKSLSYVFSKENKKTHMLIDEYNYIFFLSFQVTG